MNTYHVAIVENSENEAIIIANLLEKSIRQIFDIVHFTDIESIKNYLSVNKVDIILLNLFLKDSYGVHTFTELFRKYRHIPFLILTEFDDDEIGANAVKEGAQDYLIKSEINSQSINKAIIHAIERKHFEEQLRNSEQKYKNLFQKSKDAIYISTVDGDFIDINEAGLSLFDYTINDLDALKVADLYVRRRDRMRLKRELSEFGEVIDYPVELVKKDGVTLVYCLLSTTVVRDNKDKIIAYQGIIRDITEKRKSELALIKSMQDLDQANKELLFLNTSLEDKVSERTKQLKKEKELAEIQHKEIKESINYAKRIQASILPPMQKIKHRIPNSFIFYLPKDIVSGDFYWYAETKNRSFIAIVDCTGHGVPGAFMSIIGYTQLNEIMSEGNQSDPGEILKDLDRRVRLALNQNSINGKNSKDGMELGIISIDHEMNRLEYAGAMRPLFFIKQNELKIIKGDKFSIGGISRRKKVFVTHKIHIEENDCFYLFSDGYPDQFGGPKGKKFMAKNVASMLIKIGHLHMEEQSQVIKDAIFNWMGEEEQIDDILMAGLRF